MSEFDLNETPSTPDATPTPVASPSPATQGTPATAATPPTQTPATGAPEGYVPSYRIRESREAAYRQAQTEFATREAQIRQEADQYKRQVQALTGVLPPENSENDTIRKQFFNLFPWAEKMEKRFGDFESLVDRAGDLETQNSHYWNKHGQDTMDRLYTAATTSLGPLSNEAKQTIGTAFIGYVQSSPERTNRYYSDPGFVDGFWREFSSSVIDPVRRNATVGAVGRAPGAIPQDSPSGAPHASPTPRPANMDERVNNAWAQFQQSRGGI